MGGGGEGLTVINKGSVWRLRVGERGRGGLRVEYIGRIKDLQSGRKGGE